MNVSIVPVEYINDVWDTVKVILKPAVEVTNGRFMLYDIYSFTQMGRYQMWIAFDDDKQIHGCEVTTVTNYPSKRVLTSLFTGGDDIRSWRNQMIDVITRFAKDQDCEAIEGHGREGWIKLLEPYGVKRGLTMFEKDI
jgi:hypothetical protein